MITKDNNLKVMEVFYASPSKTFHIRELARITGLSSTGIIKIINRLKQDGLLTSEKKNVIEEIRPILETKFYLMKRLYNIYSLYESKLIEELKHFYEQPEAIILFGSCEKGTDDEKSDIDIAVITNKQKLPELTKFEKKLKRKIDILTLNLKSASKEFKNSLANGIVLEGYFELIK